MTYYKQQRDTIRNDDHEVVNELIGLLSDKPFRSMRSGTYIDDRTLLEVEFSINLFSYSLGKHSVSLSIKLGPKRLYVVQRIKEFLQSLANREPYSFSASFVYDPRLHRFRAEDDALLQELISIYRNEQAYHELTYGYSGTTRAAKHDRSLIVPPYAWERILSCVLAVKAAKLDDGEHMYDSIECSDEPLPLHFHFGEEQEESYTLHIQGLDEIKLAEPYQLAVYRGKLHKLTPEQARSLQQMEQALRGSAFVPAEHLHLSQQQMEPFIEKVIPTLQKLGKVHIAKAIANRLEHAPLKARLYLDRVRDRLLAALEFQYGNIIINPLESSTRNRASDRILIRDFDREELILSMIEQCPFARTESGYFMSEEESEFHFLHHVIPELEKLLEVHATSAIYLRVANDFVPPKMRIDWDERTDWLELSFSMDGITESELRGLIEALEEKRQYYKLPNGALLPLEGEKLQQIIRVLNDFGIRKTDLYGADLGSSLKLPVARGLHLMDSERSSEALQLGRSFRRLLNDMRNPDNLDFPVPERLQSVLRDYQAYGYQWLKTLAHYRLGGILADEMGLGKTVQSIAFLVSVLPEIRESGQPALVICPASLMYNWQAELNRFAPELRCTIADGDKQERKKTINNTSYIDVIITSYPLLRKDAPYYAKQLYHTLILDEAQAFKNDATLTAQSVKSLQARYRFALTGTPIENSLEELRSIYDAVIPGLLPDRREYSELSRDTVARRIRPFMLRRLKRDVLKELPDKIESLQASELLPEQKKLYASYLAMLQQETLKHLDENSFNKNRIKILAGLTRLRQLCCHPALFIEGYTGSSAKLEQLLDLASECRSAGKRILIFSQFTSMLAIIGRELAELDIPYFYLDGGTPAQERVDLCNRFNDGEREVFLISLKAGGTGLNLHGADTVILYDLWWNPAVEQQAADRAHRIGQKKVVQIIRLISKDTLEDKMYELQQKKLSLIEDILQPGEEALSTLTESDIRELLMIHQ